MKSAEIKEFNTKELQERIDAEASTLVKLKLNHAISPLDNPVKIRFVRKNIARMKTELQSRKLAEQK